MIGREHHSETDSSRKYMSDMTGVYIESCPWRSLQAPIVREVLHALRFFESGNLGVMLPNPSHRLIEGIGWWQQVYNRVQSKQMELDAKTREQNAKAAALQNQVQRR